MPRPALPYSYTPVPNSVLDALPTLSPAANLIVLVVCRHTLGWRKAEDRISLQQFMAATGLCKRAVQYALKEALAKSVITRRRIDEKHPRKGYVYGVVDAEFENAIGARNSHTKEIRNVLLYEPLPRSYGPLFPSPDDPAVAV